MSENKEVKSSPMIASLATPIAIVVAGVIIAGAVFYTNGFSKSNNAGTQGGLAHKYQKFIDLASVVDLDADKFTQCMDKFDATEVKSDLAEAGSYGANGTPAFFVGKTNGDSIYGVKISGAYPFDSFKGVIDGLMEGDNQKILSALPQDQEGTLAASVEEISQNVSLGDDPVLGNPDAPITIVEFSDYECPYCQRHFNTTHPQLVSEYVNSGKVKMVFRDLPLDFHDPVATQAAVAANCAREQGGDEAYFKYHDEYFTRTKANGEGLP